MKDYRARMTLYLHEPALFYVLIFDKICDLAVVYVARAVAPFCNLVTGVTQKGHVIDDYD